MKKTLIYIIGAGRSGTTLIDIVLGNNENTISLGEINRFFKREGVPPKRDQDNKVYKFWYKIKLELSNNLLQTDYKEISTVFNNNEYHSNVFKILLNHSDLSYKSALKSLYKVICNNTSEDVLVESSKYPLRALNVSKNISDINIKYIYIKKDPVKVVSSFRKKNIEQPSKSFFSANLYYLLVNILCRIVVNILKKRGHKVALVKYEDFIINPQLEITKIANSLNLDFKTLEDKLKNKNKLKTGFLFDGNRIRLKESLTLKTLGEKERKSLKYFFTRGLNFIVYR